MAAWASMDDDAYDRAEALGESSGYGWYECEFAELDAALTAAAILCDAIDAVAAEGRTAGSSPAQRHRRDDHNPGSAATPRVVRAAAASRQHPNVTEEAW